MIRIILLAGFFLVAIGCSNGIERKKAPENLIPSAEMVDIVKELCKLEAMVQSKYPSVAHFHKVMVNSGDSLLKAKGVSFENFDASMDYYASRQEEMTEIYSDALDALNKELGDLQSKSK